MFFIVFEGLDGSGKSSLMKSLENYLKSHNQELIMTREPGGTTVSEEIRSLILKKQDVPPTARTELLLYQASRAQHVDCVIRPALQQKKWVLCDRFTASSVAFQGGGRGISLEQVAWLNDFATESLQPHLTVLLDLSVEESEKRRSHRQNQTGEEQDRIESEKRNFHQKVREGFLKQAYVKLDTLQSPDIVCCSFNEDLRIDDLKNISKFQVKKNWLVLDASQSPEELFKELLTNLKDRQWLNF